MEPMKPMKPMDPGPAWWPKALGSPSSSGSQNDTRYAYFEGAHRLVVDSGGSVKTYDTGGRRIQGFGQQQGGGDAMTFQTDQGPLALSELRPA